MIGDRVKVHFNRHRGDWSVTRRGRVIANVADVTLIEVRFVVQAGGLARIRATGTRSVIAYATGVVTAYDTRPDLCDWEPVTFNPFTADTFVRNGQPVLDAPLTVFAGRCGWTPPRS